MALREFDYAGAKNIMNQVEQQANIMQQVLNQCDQCVNETVGQPRKWSGQRATNFKNNWVKTTQDFAKFGELIKEYSRTIDNAYKQHQNFEQ